MRVIIQKWNHYIIIYIYLKRNNIQILLVMGSTGYHYLMMCLSKTPDDFCYISYGRLELTFEAVADPGHLVKRGDFFGRVIFRGDF